MRNGITGASSSDSLVSCMSSTSRSARSSHSRTRSMRALSELTFQVATRIADRLSEARRIGVAQRDELTLTARQACDPCGVPREVDDLFRRDSVSRGIRQVAHLLELQMRAA